MYCNPYADLFGGDWIKTNFHTHAGTEKGTCGQNPIDTVLPLYSRLEYGAICISNHDRYTDTTQIESEMCLVQGVEYSQNEHMLTIGVNKSLHELSHQDAIDETVRQGGFVILCHPNWMRKEYWPWAKLDALHGFCGLEVINMLIYRLSGSGLATDTWDHLLAQGKLVYGFGNDDFHLFTDAGRSFTDIYTTEKSYDGIRSAIQKGCFTASTGLQLDYITLENNTIAVKARFWKDTYINTFCYKFISETGLLQESSGEAAQYTLQGEKYIRVEVMAENGAMLFTQPVYDTGFFR